MLIYRLSNSLTRDLSSTQLLKFKSKEQAGVFVCNVNVDKEGTETALYVVIIVLGFSLLCQLATRSYLCEPSQYGIENRMILLTRKWGFVRQEQLCLAYG